MAEEISGSKIKGSVPGVDLGTPPCIEASGARELSQHKRAEGAYVGNGLRERRLASLVGTAGAAVPLHEQKSSLPQDEGRGFNRK